MDQKKARDLFLHNHALEFVSIHDAFNAGWNTCLEAQVKAKEPPKARFELGQVVLTRSTNYLGKVSSMEYFPDEKEWYYYLNEGITPYSLKHLRPLTPAEAGIPKADK